MPSMKTWNNYGGLYVEDGSTAEDTTDATPRKIAGFTTAMPNGDNSTISTSTDDISVVGAGDYLVTSQISFSGSLSKTFIVEIYVEGVATDIKCERKLGTGGDVGSASVCGIVTLAANDSVSLYHSSTDGGLTFTLQNGQFTLTRLS